MQFTKLYTQLFEQGFNANEVVTYSLIHDRMNSSIQRRDFFDVKQQDFYVIFTNTEIAQKINVSERTVSTIINKLAKAGLIVLKRQYNNATRIFVPGFVADNDNQVITKEHNETPQTLSNQAQANFAGPDTQNLQTNQTNLNHTNQITNDTYDTQRIEKKDELDRLAKSLIEKGGLSKKLVRLLKAYANQPADLYQYASLIYKAKALVEKQAQQHPRAYEATHFESNPLLNDTLTKKIKFIILNAEKHAQNKAAYLLRSLTNLFENTANEFLVGEK